MKRRRVKNKANKQKDAPKISPKTILLSTLPVVLVVLVIVVIAVASTVAKNNRKAPMIKDADGQYVVVGEGDNEYYLTKGEMYSLLKDQYGVNALLEILDREILENGEKNYLAQVTDAEIQEELEKEMYKDLDLDKATAEEKAEAEAKFYDARYIQGLRTEAAIKKYYHLELAKKAYAADFLEKEIEEKDAEAEDDTEKYFTKSAIETKYNSLYKDTYFALIIEYPTRKEAYSALEQLGYKIKDQEKDENGVLIPDSYTKWVKIPNEEQAEEELTREETIKAFIDLYNTLNSYKVTDYPTETLTLKEGVQYTIDADGHYVFHQEVIKDEDGEISDDPKNALLYTEDELKAIGTAVLSDVMNFKAYDSETSVVDKDQRWFKNYFMSLDSGKKFVSFIKIKTISKPTLEEVQDKVIEKLKKDTLTSSYVTKAMYHLRATKDLVLYDKEIETYYKSQANTHKAEFETSKARSKDLIAKFGDIEYSVEDFYHKLNNDYGMNVAINEINFQRVLNNPEINKIYDVKNERVLDKKAWAKIKTKFADEKAQYANYSAYMSWSDYMKYRFQANNEDEVKIRLLYEQLSAEATKPYTDFSLISETDPIWTEYYMKNMENVKDKYYKVSGYHLLIYIVDEENSTADNEKLVDPKDWTPKQIELAEELYAQVQAYLVAKGDYKAQFDKITQAFTDAPLFQAHLPQDAASQPVFTINDMEYDLDGMIDVSKFKTAGLKVKYENLNVFEYKLPGQSGGMVEAFNEGVKKVWDLNPDSTEDQIFGVTVAIGEHLVTEFGYHVYVNTKTYPLATYKVDDVEYTFPTFELATKYLNGDTIKDSDQKTVAEFWLKGLKEDATKNNSHILTTKQKGLTFDFKEADFSNADYQKFLGIVLKDGQDALIYKAHLD
jgi:hypothetical protein